VDVFGMNVYAEGRGNWIEMVNPAPGVVTPGDFHFGTIRTGFRTPTFSQTDLSISQEMHVSKQNERLKLGIEMNFTNIFNQHSPTYINSNMTNTGGIAPLSVDPFADPGACTDSANPAFVADPRCIVDYPFLLNAQYNYVNELNGLGLDQSHAGLNPLYGRPYGWQNPRGIRFKVKFTF